jgi:hypothetical protein
MEVLLKDRAEVVRAPENQSLDHNSPVLWTRTLTLYNGGPKNAGKRYDQMPGESQRYSVHAIRYITDAAIASGLRQKGMNDHEIHEAMISPQIDADAYAYSKAVDFLGGMHSMEAYETVWSVIAGIKKAKHDNPKLYHVIEQGRKDFKAGKSGFKLPLTPALRIWTVHNGLALLDDMPENMDPKNYQF